MHKVTSRRAIAMMLGASEEYYVCLDDDARFIDGDEIEIAIEFMESRPSVAAVAFDIIAKWRPEKRPRGDSNAVRTFIGCGHILRLSVLKQLGGYAKFPGSSGCEEKDLCLRIIDYSPDGRDESQYLSGLHNDLAMVLRRAPLPILLPALIWRAHQQFRLARKINCAHVLPKVVLDFVRAVPSLWHGRRPVRMLSIARYWALPPPD